MHADGSISVQITADFKVGGNGSVEFKEEDGIDYAPVTVQLPGGERVAFLFTIKQLDAKGSLDSFSGDFTVPSYRGSSFLDPKVCTYLLILLIFKEGGRGDYLVFHFNYRLTRSPPFI